MSSLITQGMSKTFINDKLVQYKQYMGTYDGEIGKLLMRNRNEGIYVELDNNDLAEMFQKREFGEKNEKSIDKKLKTLIKKHRTLKKSSALSSRGKKTRNKRKKVKKIKKKGLIKKNKKRKTKKRRKHRKNKNTIKKNKSYKDIITPTDDIFD